MNRVKQFIRCLTAKINEEDYIFINQYLSEKETELLYKLPIYDIKHCINVARDIRDNENKVELNNIKLNYNEVIKSGLLHDVGKSIRPLNPVEKASLVLLSKFTGGRIKRHQNKSKRIYIYFNHGEEGYKLLNKNEYSKEFLYVVRYHHDYSKNDSWLNLLRKYDDMN